MADNPSLVSEDTFDFDEYLQFPTESENTPGNQPDTYQHCMPYDAPRAPHPQDICGLPPETDFPPEINQPTNGESLHIHSNQQPLSQCMVQQPIANYSVANHSVHSDRVEQASFTSQDAQLVPPPYGVQDAKESYERQATFLQQPHGHILSDAATSIQGLDLALDYNRNPALASFDGPYNRFPTVEPVSSALVPFGSSFHSMYQTQDLNMPPAYLPDDQYSTIPSANLASALVRILA